MEKKSCRGGKIRVWGREKGKEREGKRRFSRCSDGRSSIVRELKYVHATRATCRYQNPNFRRSSKRYGFSPTLVPFHLRAINGRMVQPQPWDCVFRH